MDGFCSAASRFHSLKAFPVDGCDARASVFVCTVQQRRLRGSPCSPQTDRKTDRRAECEEGKWSDRRTLTSSGQQPVSARKHMSPNHRRQRLKRPRCSVRLTWKISYRRSFGIDVTAHTCTKTNKSLGRIHI